MNFHEVLENPLWKKFFFLFLLVISKLHEVCLKLKLKLNSDSGLSNITFENSSRCFSEHWSRIRTLLNVTWLKAVLPEKKLRNAEEVFFSLIKRLILELGNSFIFFTFKIKYFFLLNIVSFLNGDKDAPLQIQIGVHYFNVFF